MAGLYTVYFKFGKNTAEMHQMFKQPFDDNSLGQTQTYDGISISKWPNIDRP
jgi:hypothetical protein